MRKFLVLLLILVMSSCVYRPKHHKIYKTTEKDGYCYYDHDYWYLYYLDDNCNCYYKGTANRTFTLYDKTSNVTNWLPTPETVTNYSEMPETAQESAMAESESTGESVGSSDIDNTSEGEGMSESSGEASGGSDSGGGDSGGGDGGGDGGGGD